MKACFQIFNNAKSLKEYLREIFNVSQCRGKEWKYFLMCKSKCNISQNGKNGKKFPNLEKHIKNSKFDNLMHITNNDTDAHCLLYLVKLTWKINLLWKETWQNLKISVSQNGKYHTFFCNQNLKNHPIFAKRPLSVIYACRRFIKNCVFTFLQ